MINDGKYESKLKKDLTSDISGWATLISYNNSEKFTVNQKSVEGYFYDMPDNIKVFSNVIEYLSNIDSKNIKGFITELIKSFQEVLIKEYNEKYIYNHLPKMKIEEQDDSIFLEWIFKDFRIGFSIEDEIDESTWYIITNVNLEEFTKSGYINKKNYCDIVFKIIKYVLENT